MRKIAWVSVALLLSMTAAAMAAGKSAAVQLREGLYAEEVEGNLDSAIKIYQQVIDDKAAPKDQIAQALYRQGMCYMKKKSETEAKADFARIVAEHSDQTDLVAKVKPLLDELGNADPAALMPTETLLYAEIGSPGKQVEAILNMLKGTPLENPLAAIGGSGQGGNQQGPAAIVSALLNPSMMAEFKKIRGMGVGIQEISQGTPSAVIVMYPGKSDALRGILQMVISVAGKQPEVVDGMQTVRCGNEGAAAYDDTVVIVTIGQGTKAPERLKWVIQQYKGLTSHPTLATSNKSFAKVSKKARQENVLTLWVNVDEAYQTMMKQFPPDKVPQQIRVADGFVDLKNVDEIIAALTLKESGIAFEANVDLKNGHNCTVYNLIHTPNLNTGLFKAVPSEATALFAFALGDANTPQAAAAGQQIKNITGLDIGREIFANIKQVSFFALPTVKTPNQPEGASVFPVGSLGLAITSADPQQTRRILGTILQSTSLMAPAADGQAQEIKVVDGKFRIDLVNKQQVFGYVDDASKTTVFALSSSTVDGSAGAVRQRKSVLDAGRLKNSVTALPASTSKLAVINVAGQLRIAAANVRLSDPNATEKVQKAFTQLAQMCEQTTILLRTTEETNSLGARFEITGLPKADQVVGPITELVGLLQNGGNEWSNEEEQPQMPAELAKATSKPAIDGKVDDVWAAAKSYDLKNNLYKPVSGPADCSASFKAMYDNDNLYILVDVNDEELKHDSPEFYNDDCVEIFIDADNGKATSYGEKDHTYDFVWDAAAPVMGKRGQPVNDGTQFAFAKTEKGYRLEVQFPWATLKGKPSPGAMFGLDIHVNDDDDGGERDSKLTWSDKKDNAWQNPRAFGIAQIPGMVGWWKLDETEGNTAADSSGHGHNGTLKGSPKWLPTGGKVGGALQFDGEGSYVDTSLTQNLPTWSVALWVKSPAAPKSDQGESGPIHREKNFQINWNHQTDAFRGAAALSVGGIWYGAGFGDLQADAWYHLAATYDGENLKAFKNGVQTADNAEPSGAPNGESVSMKLAKHATSELCFTGTIDDARVYNYAISAAEIAALAGVK
jgi:hypothetical protein